jgi:hypothetical protein
MGLFISALFFPAVEEVEKRYEKPGLKIINGAKIQP